MLLKRLWAALKLRLFASPDCLERMDLRAMHTTLHDLVKTRNWGEIDRLLLEASSKVPSATLICLIHCTAPFKDNCRSWTNSTIKVAAILAQRGESDPGLACLLRTPAHKMLL